MKFPLRLAGAANFTFTKILAVETGHLVLGKGLGGAVIPQAAPLFGQEPATYDVTPDIALWAAIPVKNLPQAVQPFVQRFVIIEAMDCW